MSADDPKRTYVEMVTVFSRIKSLRRRGQRYGHLNIQVFGEPRPSLDGGAERKGSRRCFKGR